MNFSKHIALFTVASGMVVSMTSCLKDAKVPSDPSLGTNNVVQFQNISVPISYTSIYPQYDLGGLLFTPDTSGFNINVSWTGQQYTAPEDITVTLSLDTAALSAFNADQGTNFVTPPTDVATYPASLVIKKGSPISIGRAVVTAASDFDFNAQYALALTITAASSGTISTNYGTAIFSFGGRNKYDGQYTMTQKTTGWAAYSINDGGTYTWPTNVLIVTSGAATNTVQTEEEKLLFAAFSPTGGTLGFGATEVQFGFDISTNALTSVTNLVPDDGRDRAFALNPAVTDSRYDPTTGTIYAAFIMSQTGRPPQFVYDTLVYQSAR